MFAGWRVRMYCLWSAADVVFPGVDSMQLSRIEELCVLLRSWHGISYRWLALPKTVEALLCLNLDMVIWQCPNKNRFFLRAGFPNSVILCENIFITLSLPIVRARELTFWENAHLPPICHMPPFTCHISRATGHMSCHSFSSFIPNRPLGRFGLVVAMSVPDWCNLIFIFFLWGGLKD